MNIKTFEGIMPGIVDENFSSEIYCYINRQKRNVKNGVYSSLSRCIDSMAAELMINRFNGKNTSEIRKNLFNGRLFDYTVPVLFGGVGGRFMDFITLITRIAELDVGIAVTAVPHTCMGIGSIVKFGTENQKKNILPDIYHKNKLIAFGLTEGGVGSDITRISTTLKKTTENTFKLDGSKVLITNASLSDYIVVVAKCPELTRNPQGLCFVIVSSQKPGLVITEPYNKLSVRTSVTCEIQLNGCEVKEEDILGVAGKGAEQFNELVKGGRLGVAAGAIGIAWKVHSMCNNDASGTISKVDIDILRMESCLKVTAAGYDCNCKETNILSALVKVYCTEKCRTIIRNYLLNSRLSIKENLMIAQDMFDASILRITEGPNDPVAYRCALEMVMRIGMEIEKNECDSNKNYQPIIKIYMDILKMIYSNVCPLTGNQFILYQAFMASMSIFSWWAASLEFDSFVEKKGLSDEDGRKVYISMFNDTFQELKKILSSLRQQIQLKQCD